MILLIILKLNFLCQKTFIAKLKQKRKFLLIFFCYENKLTFPIHITDQKLENSMDLLLTPDENKSHQVYIKDFDRFMFQKIKMKDTFAS